MVESKVMVVEPISLFIEAMDEMRKKGKSEVIVFVRVKDYRRMIRLIKTRMMLKRLMK